MGNRDKWYKCYQNFHNSHVAAEFTHTGLDQVLGQVLKKGDGKGGGANVLLLTSQLAIKVNPKASVVC